VEDKDCIDSGFRQQFEPLRQERQELRSLSGPQELCRVRIKGDGNGPHATRPRFLGGGTKVLLMAAMHAIEVADGRNAWTESGGNLRE
jgi:hypothetical protein